jgi:hypothetical protein
MVASYNGAMLKVTELLSKGHSIANVCLWRMHCCVLDFILLSATGVAEMAESMNLKWFPHTFGHVVCDQTFLNSIWVHLTYTKVLLIGLAIAQYTGPNGL